jgi:hypothetical protein
VTKLKKTYSAIANTANLAMAENGPMSGWVVENGKGVEFADKYLIPYLKVSKNCGSSTTGECEFKFKYRNGSSGTLNSSVSKFYLNDGVFIGVTAMNTIYSGVLRRQAEIFVDINGQKKPNLIGKDVFHFIYYIYWEGRPGNSGKLGTYGYQDRANNLSLTDPAGCNNTGGSGEYCTKVIMQDSWQILDDYPWN